MNGRNKIRVILVITVIYNLVIMMMISSFAALLLFGCCSVVVRLLRRLAVAAAAPAAAAPTAVCYFADQDVFLKSVNLLSSSWRFYNFCILDTWQAALENCLETHYFCRKTATYQKIINIKLRRAERKAIYEMRLERDEPPSVSRVYITCADIVSKPRVVQLSSSRFIDCLIWTGSVKFILPLDCAYDIK